MDKKTEMTFSVKQLAQMLRRSEQTVRRWKDQGKLIACEGGEGGGLAFTESAVRDLLQMNPRLLDKATPQLVMLLYTDTSDIPTQRSTTIANFLSMGLNASEEVLVPGYVLREADSPSVAKLSAKRMGEKEEEPVTAIKWKGGVHPMNSAKTETAETGVEEERTAAASGVKVDSYLYRLLLNREQRVRETIAQLSEELEQIQKEKAILEAEHAQGEELTP